MIKRYLAASAGAFFILCLGAEAVHAGAAARFARIVYSPRANALGGAAIGLIDQESVFYNPAAMALYHSDTRIAFTPPLRNSWMPSLADDLRIAGVSLSGRLGSLSASGNTISGGISGRIIDYGMIPSVSPEVANPYEVVGALSVGAVNHGAVNIAVGVNALSVLSRLSSSPDPDSGKLRGQGDLLDIAGMIEGSFFPNSFSSGIAPRSDFRYRAAILYTLYSSDFSHFSASIEDPGPKTLQLAGGVSAEFGDPLLRKFKALLVAQRESDMSDATNRAPTVNRAGLEVSLYEMIYLRGGMFDEGPQSSTVKTFGAGFSLYGMLRLAHGSSLGRFVESGFRLDVMLDYARYSSEQTSALSETSFWKVSVAWH